MKQLNLHIPDLPVEAVQSIKALTLVIIGDSDIVRPEHAVDRSDLLISMITEFLDAPKLE